MEKELSQVRAILAEVLGLPRYEMWIQPSRMEVSNCIWINLFACSPFAYEQLAPLRGRMEVAVRKMFPQYFIRLFPPSDGTLLPKLFILDKFITGGENQCLSSLLHKLTTENHKKPSPPFVFSVYGQDGLGKSHFLKTLQQARKSTFSQEKIFLIQGRDFWDCLKGSLESHRFKTLLSADLWLIDDFYLEENLPSQRRFLNLFNKWLDHPRPLVITSSKPLRSYPFVLDALYSRLAHGVHLRIDPPTLETRLALAYASFPEASKFSREVINFFARQLTNPAQLLEWLDKLKREKGFSATLAQAQTLLAPLDIELSPEKILGQVARYFEVDPQDLSSLKQRRNVTKAKKMAAYLLYTLLALSHKQIQPYLGQVSTATIRLYCRTVGSGKDPLFNQALRDLLPKAHPVIKALSDQSTEANSPRLGP